MYIYTCTQIITQKNFNYIFISFFIYAIGVTGVLKGTCCSESVKMENIMSKWKILMENESEKFPEETLSLETDSGKKRSVQC